MIQLQTVSLEENDHSRLSDASDRRKLAATPRPVCRKKRKQKKKTPALIAKGRADPELDNDSQRIDETCGFLVIIRNNG